MENRCNNCSVKRNVCPALDSGIIDKYSHIRREQVCMENIQQIDSSKTID